MTERIQLMLVDVFYNEDGKVIGAIGVNRERHEAWFLHYPVPGTGQGKVIPHLLDSESGVRRSCPDNLCAVVAEMIDDEDLNDPTMVPLDPSWFNIVPN